MAYRKSGRRIRAELVRKGLPASVVALPPGLVANHALPVHLWELRWPAEGAAAPTRIRMDARSAQLPQMDIERQREYGAAFRRLADFADRLRARSPRSASGQQARESSTRSFPVWSTR
ncbi:hypothetical protein ACGF12_28605 [Kitasatospora sp. NPDC048296]|uniref:hypothetical protein n=1 Tax=Kitasatospora sp. NPDC048296 TaxID=3364048 RepID=UPI0037122F3E